MMSEMTKLVLYLKIIVVGGVAIRVCWDGYNCPASSDEIHHDRGKSHTCNIVNPASCHSWTSKQALVSTTTLPLIRSLNASGSSFLYSS